VTSQTISTRGVVLSATAALLWAFVPVYIGVLGDVDTVEIVAHRALWSGVILLGLVLLMPQMTGGVARVRAVLERPELRRGLMASCAMLTANWMVFVYAVQTRQVFDAVLGYFIYPLVTVVLGVVILRERLDRWGWIAVGIVAAGVTLKAVAVGGLPWIAATLAVTFGLYGVIRKRLGVDAIMGMFIETMILVPPAIGYLVWMLVGGNAIFFGGGSVNLVLAIFAGVITVVPLILYHAGNRALPIIVASLLFYINPTTQMLIGLFHFNVPLPAREWVVFGLIWAGLVLYFATRHTAADTAPDTAADTAPDTGSVDHLR